VEEKLFFLLASLRLLLKRDKSQRGCPLDAACLLHLASQGRGSSCSAHHAIYQAFELHAAEPLYIQVADSDTIYDVNVCAWADPRVVDRVRRAPTKISKTSEYD
jgi:hypothetical protein